MIEAFRIVFTKRVNVEPQTYAITVFVNPDHKSIFDKVSHQFGDLLTLLAECMESE